MSFNKYESKNILDNSVFINEKFREPCDQIVSRGKNSVFCKTNGNLTVNISKSNYIYGSELFIDVYKGSYFKHPIVYYHDEIKDCPVDFFIGYIKNSLSFTDLDNNGKEEITFAYQKICTGGIEPSDLVILKIEEEVIYSLKSKRILKMDVDRVKGIYKSSPNFLKAPEVFFEHSEKLWKKYLVE